MSFYLKKRLSFLFIFVIIVGILIHQTPIIKADIVLDNAQADKARLESELLKLEQEIVEKQKELDNQKGQSVSLSRDISILNAQIAKSKLDIKAKNLTIQKLGGEINNKSKKIEALSVKIEKEKESLSQLIRKERQLDNTSLLYFILSQESLSDVYGDIDNFASIKKGIKNSVDEIKGIQVVTETEKKSLEIKKDQETDTKYELENAKAKVELSESEKKQLLSISKNKEVEYQKVLAQRKAEAQRIRNILIQFQGSGISSRAISFGEAYDYAKKASIKTGVRPALILAIMQQETGFGNNVGGCYVSDLTTGDGVGINTGAFYEKVMGSGSLIHFKRITENLNLDWSKTPVSCPIDVKRIGTATKYYTGRGYGGAMGYTQFIPSTWVLVESRVVSYLETKIGNPWNPEHAVMATSVFLQDLGASSQTYTAEYNSACRYYGACSTYAGSVMKKSKNIQLDIDKLENI
jgi:hypothetical protein